jgi:hypothetical protein
MFKNTFSGRVNLRKNLIQRIVLLKDPIPNNNIVIIQNYYL